MCVFEGAGGLLIYGAIYSCTYQSQGAPTWWNKMPQTMVGWCVTISERILHSSVQSNVMQALNFLLASRIMKAVDLAQTTHGHFDLKIPPVGYFTLVDVSSCLQYIINCFNNFSMCVFKSHKTKVLICNKIKIMESKFKFT